EAALAAIAADRETAERRVTELRETAIRDLAQVDARLSAARSQRARSVRRVGDERERLEKLRLEASRFDARHAAAIEGRDRLTRANESAALEIGATPFDGFIREYRDSTIAALATVSRWRDSLPIVLVAFLVAIAIAGLVEAVSGASLSASLLLIAGLLAIGLAVSRR